MGETENLINEYVELSERRAEIIGELSLENMMDLFFKLSERGLIRGVDS